MCIHMGSYTYLHFLVLSIERSNDNRYQWTHPALTSLFLNNVLQSKKSWPLGGITDSRAEVGKLQDEFGAPRSARKFESAFENYI